jgi:DHA2 family multidrug resistance protein
LVLFGTTVLLPQFVQSLLGYTAELAGLVISPGGLMVMLMMPIVGFLVSRVDPRWMIVYGFAILRHGAVHHAGPEYRRELWHVALLRVFQAAGLAFLFIPINTLSYTGIPGNKNNDVSGLTNLARNIGGSMGTAFVVTVLARRQQFHQARLSAGVDLSSLNLHSRVEALGRFLLQHQGKVSSLAQGRALAQGNLYQTLLQQSTMLAYLDVIKLLAIAMVAAIPLVFLMKRPKKGAAPVGH